MPSNVSLPFFPLPPKEYSQAYMAEIIRSFSVFLNQYNNSLQDGTDLDTSEAIGWFIG
tara:strand:- start:3022 stop:3195 length:174 start_codon:yes stop_codon:yes gene_type:complete